MSGFPGSSNGFNGGGLENLFAQMRQRNSSASPNPAGGSSFTPPPNDFTEHSRPSSFHGFQPANVSSPIPTPPVNNEPPHHASAIMSPAVTSPQSTPGISVAKANHTNSLLNLLKFSGPPTTSQPSAGQIPHIRAASHGHPSANVGNTSDLLATLMGKSTAQEDQELNNRLRSASEKPQPPTVSASADTQAYLLQLLNRPKPAQTENSRLQLEQSMPVLSPKTEQNAEVSELTKTLEEATLGKISEPQVASKSTQGLFTYVNPFDQLAASSPRNRTPKPSASGSSSSTSAPPMQILKPPRKVEAEGSDLKRKVQERSPSNSPAHSKIKLNTNNSSPLNEGRSKETVSDALNEVGGRVDKQVEEALARAEDDQRETVIEKDLKAMADAKTESEFEDAAHIAAMDIKKELEKEGNEGILRDSLPESVALAVKEIVDETAKGAVDNWESEAGSQVGEDRVVVYNFPMRPWTSITVTEPESYAKAVFKDASIFDIARLKKDFDQIDRTLATATSTFIVYGMSKNGGIRVIRQSDGKDVKLFQETHDRVFNVSISTATDNPSEAVIGTGVSGTVYWAEVRSADGEDVHDTGNKDNGFALPPIQSGGEETSGGMLKTRARKSSCHPEFFAVGRGKSIHIIWPSVITKQAYLKDGPERVVDIKKYLQHQSLKINTGKAGKDFVFSQDDTVIVSLDKAGKLKFWDVRTLTNTDRGGDLRFPTPEQIQPIEIKEPIMCLNTTPDKEKSWPTSVQFIDKLRPYQKGLALRYLLVGLKQNHTFQLWDLCLLKPVQEIHLPHEKESDAVCSISYHAATGILAVAHPTRNSIFFIHLSAPRYDIGKRVSQAELMQRLARQDTSLSPPGATAVLSGIREYSFEQKGLLRSLDMLQTPTGASENPENPDLFELYAMHSKGVSCIYIKQQDMGWDKDNKVLAPRNAEETGMIKVEKIRKIDTIVEEAFTPATKTIISRSSQVKESAGKDTPRTPESNGHTGALGGAGQSSSRAKSPIKTSPIKSEILTPSSGGTPGGVSAGPVPSSSERSEKSEKKRKKKATANNEASAAEKTITHEAHHTIRSESVDRATGETIVEVSEEPSAETLKKQQSVAGGPGLSQASIDAAVKAIEASISGQVSDLFTGSLNDLYKRFDSDKRVQNAQGVANQEAVIRLISSTLTDNVQKSLEQIVSANMKKSVIPAVSDITSKAINEQLGNKLNTQLKNTLPKELSSILPDILTKTLQKPEFLQAMSTALANTIASKVDEHFTHAMHKSIIPAFTKLAAQSAEKAAEKHIINAQRQYNEVLERKLEEQNKKIESLITLMGGIGNAVSSVAGGLSQMQAHMLSMQDERDSEPQSNDYHQSPELRTDARGTQPAPHSRAIAPPRSEKEVQLENSIENITLSMTQGDYDDACMRWLQTDQAAQQEIFDQYFSKIEPDFLRRLNPLLMLSIGSAVSVGLETQTLLERLHYLEAVLPAYQAANLDDSTRDVTPRIMALLNQRLEHLLIRVNSASPQDPILRRISALSVLSNRISAEATNMRQLSAPAW